MSIQEIHDAIPHRPPFLLVDEIVERSDDRIVCRKTFREDEWFFAGHYPTFPIAPGVLLCEAAMQAGAILLARNEGPIEGGIPVAAGMNNVRFRRMIKPGDTIEMEVKLTNRIAKAWFLSARVTCDGQCAVRLEFICAVAPTDAA
ncbi:MAG: beta-hydroxyacyl-ACP dehydratase [Planctomycetota bacterium]|nr:MAG: beta-hydroxyacyl-ACP dehydratase [Planctomycetota bacterium]